MSLITFVVKIIQKKTIFKEKIDPRNFTRSNVSEYLQRIKLTVVNYHWALKQQIVLNNNKKIK